MTRDSEGPVCPFCGAAWTGEMLAELDRFTMPSGCSCCGGAPAAHAAHVPVPAPVNDLCCAACGRAIYRAVAPAPADRMPM